MTESKRMEGEKEGNRKGQRAGRDGEKVGGGGVRDVSHEEQLKAFGNGTGILVFFFVLLL